MRKNIDKNSLTKFHTLGEDFGDVFEDIKECSERSILTIGKYTKRFESAISKKRNNHQAINYYSTCIESTRNLDIVYIPSSCDSKC